MEFRCNACQHVGAASEVRPTGAGVMLVCASCGRENLLAVGEAPSPDRSESQHAEGFSPERARQVLGQKSPDPSDEMQRIHEETMRRLVPEAGQGPRCPKCVHLLPMDATHCTRCGLDVEQARKFEGGPVPWERPPEGKEAQWEQARLLRDALVEHWSDENFDKFADFVREEGLLEMATRTMKRRLVEHPEDEDALALLGEIAQDVQSRIIVARAHAEANAEALSSVTKRAKTTILWTTLFVWLIVLLILVLAYAC